MITPEQLDAIRETINISAGQGASALSSLLECRVDMEFPEIKVVPTQEVREILEKETEKFIFFYSNFEKSFKGVILIAYGEREKEKLVKLIWEKYGISTEGEGLLAEVSNIIFGSFIGGLAELAKINVSFTPPKRLEDPSEITHFDDPFVILGEVALIPEINGKITAKIITIPTRDSISLLLDKLRRLLE